VSLRTLHRAFAAQGHTFAGTLRELRLARAGELLRRPQLAHVGEIGRRCGFADASHFPRAFLRAMGVSPAQWRRGGRGRPQAKRSTGVTARAGLWVSALAHPAQQAGTRGPFRATGCF